jgi:hypothetical protein
MVSPVTGPFQSEVIRNGTGDLAGNQTNRKKRLWYRQRRPYNLPLTFSMNADDVVSYKPWGPYQGQGVLTLYYSSAPLPVADTSSALYAKAWSDFREEVASSANMALTLLERKQAFEMISKRTIQFARFVKSVRAFKFKEAARILGVQIPTDKQRKRNRPPFNKPFRVKKNAKAFADNVLEYQFGWAPLIQDCYQAVNILSEPFSSGFARGRARMVTESTSTANYSTNYGQDLRTYKTTVDQSFRISATVRVTNPNLHLAGQMGFANPAVLAYESVPFSFVLNWFVTLEEYLNSFYPFPGVELLNSYYTFKGTSTQTTSQRKTSVYLNGGKTWFGVDGVCRRVLVSRTAGAIPGPSLRVRVPWNLSPSRGLNAVSLLLQRLR